MITKKFIILSLSLTLVALSFVLNTVFIPVDYALFLFLIVALLKKDTYIFSENPVYIFGLLTLIMWLSNGLIFINYLVEVEILAFISNVSVAGMRLCGFFVIEYLLRNDSVKIRKWSHFLVQYLLIFIIRLIIYMSTINEVNIQVIIIEICCIGFTYLFVSFMYSRKIMFKLISK